LLEEEGFLHRRSSKFKGILPAWYHTTWHSRDYIVGRLRGLFEQAKYVTIDDGIQDIVLAKFPLK